MAHAYHVMCRMSWHSTHATLPVLPEATATAVLDVPRKRDTRAVIRNAHVWHEWVRMFNRQRRR